MEEIIQSSVELLARGARLWAVQTFDKPEAQHSRES